jgi:hypothetical protein
MGATMNGGTSSEPSSTPSLHAAHPPASGKATCLAYTSPAHQRQGHPHGHISGGEMHEFFASMATTAWRWG